MFQEQRPDQSFLSRVDEILTDHVFNVMRYKDPDIIEILLSILSILWGFVVAFHGETYQGLDHFQGLAYMPTIAWPIAALIIGIMMFIGRVAGSVNIRRAALTLSIWFWASVAYSLSPTLNIDTLVYVFIASLAVIVLWRSWLDDNNR